MKKCRRTRKYLGKERQKCKCLHDVNKTRVCVSVFVWVSECECDVFIIIWQPSSEFDTHSIDVCMIFFPSTRIQNTYSWILQIILCHVACVSLIFICNRHHIHSTWSFQCVFVCEAWKEKRNRDVWEKNREQNNGLQNTNGEYEQSERANVFLFFLSSWNAKMDKPMSRTWHIYFIWLFSSTQIHICLHKGWQHSMSGCAMRKRNNNNVIRK